MLPHIASPWDASLLFQLAFVWRLVVAALLGALLGLERSIAGKHAGMRTYALVSLGSCLFVVMGTVASLELGGIFSGINPVQIAASVVLGIGFIGAGLTGFRGENPEVTTATGTWVAAGVGMACGFGSYLIAFSATVLAILIFSMLLKFENSIRARYGKESD